MFDWSSDPFSGRSSWFSVPRGGARRRPKPEDGANPSDEDLQPEGQPGLLAADEEAQAQPISLFKKAGWVEAESKFKTEATLFAEFQIPQALMDRPVEFQLLRRKDGGFVYDASALGKPDASGRATAKVAIHKDYSDSETFRIQARHGGGPWSNSKNTDREVRETAEEVFEHKAVSGIHFPENSSFIVPAYLTPFRELDKAFSDWRRTHPNAKLVVFGHAERNEEDPRTLSERRAKIAFAFLTGDYSTWGSIAREEKWGVWEQQHMLQAMGFYKGRVDGLKGPKTDKAILDFITWLNENECKGINPMLGFTEEYIRLELYRVYITASKRAVSIPSGKFRTVSGYPYVGCTTFNRYKGGEGNHGENRRATFLMLAESASFPVTFPCKSTVGPCEAEAGKAGERAVKGFRCKFYDDMVKQEKVGEAATSGSGYEIETHWRGYPRQNDFNEDILAAAKKYSIEPLLLKSLIAQESAFDPKANNNVGFAGLTQVGGSAIEEAGLSKGATEKTAGKYVYDFEGDERFDSRKSIYAGALIFSIKRKRIDSLIFKKFKKQPADSEKVKFYLAAYNAGEGTVKNSWVENGEVDCTWEDLIEGKSDSPLWTVIPESWSPKDKYREITNYVAQILERKGS